MKRRKGYEDIIKYFLEVEEQMTENKDNEIDENKRKRGKTK